MEFCPAFGTEQLSGSRAQRLLSTDLVIISNSVTLHSKNNYFIDQRQNLPEFFRFNCHYCTFHIKILSHVIYLAAVSDTMNGFIHQCVFAVSHSNQLKQLAQTCQIYLMPNLVRSDSFPRIVVDEDMLMCESFHAYVYSGFQGTVTRVCQ